MMVNANETCAEVDELCYVLSFYIFANGRDRGEGVSDNDMYESQLNCKDSVPGT